MKQLSQTKWTGRILLVLSLSWCLPAEVSAQVSQSSEPQAETTLHHLHSAIDDSLVGFDADKVMKKLSERNVQPWEAAIALARAKRRYIDKKYNLAPGASQHAGPVNPTPQTPCTNMDFETGAFTGWSGFIGDNTLNSNGPLQAIQNGIFQSTVNPVVNAPVSDNTARHTLMNTAGGNDPCGGFPVVAPGGNWSVRLGNTYALYQGEAIEQTFTVAAGNTSFTYQYAVVLNDGGHSSGEQPYFRIELFDQSGNLIPCGQYYVDATNALSSFQNCGVGTYYKPWTTVNIDLTNYMASSVTIRFTAAGCIYGGHYGYAYVDASCLPYTITQSDSLCAGSSITLSAPVGAASYQWSTGATTPSITVNAAGTYTVNMVSVTGCTTQLTQVVSLYPQPTASFNPAVVACQPTINFTNNSSISSGNLTYHWDFGDPNIANDTSNALNPTWTYATPGTYTVTLIVTSASGCADTVTAIVNPGNAGQAAFAANNACVNNAIQFTDQSINPTSWQWNFGDGSPLNSSQNPSHAYTTAGQYTVTLTAQTQNSNCPSVATQVINVYPSPTAAFNTSGSCSSLTVGFNDLSTISSGSITTWSWNFGDLASGGNNTSALQNPSHTFSAAGSYTVILTVTSANGCQATVNLPVSVGNPPVAAFTQTNVCTNSPMLFTNNSQYGTWYHWDFGDGATLADTSNLQNPAYTYTTSGTYTVWLYAYSNSSCFDSTSVQVTVNPGPSPAFVAPNVCLNSPSQFTDLSTISSGTITSWHWDFGVNAQTADTSNLQNPQFQYPAAGSYVVTLTTTSANGCTTTMTQNVLVDALPVALFSNNSVCAGTPMNFTDLSAIATGTITGWQWDFGDGSPQTNLQNPTHIYPNDSSYTVTLIVTTAAGCTDTIQQVVNTYPYPQIAFSADTTSGCMPLCVNFSDLTSVSSGSITGWAWNFGDGSPTSFQQNPVHCYSTPGTYSVKLTTTTGIGCVASDSIVNYITVWPLPVASASATPNPTTVLNTTVYFTDQSQGAAQWLWNFGDNSTSTDSSTLQNPSYTYSTEVDGSYTVQLIVENQYGCVDDTTIEIIVAPEFTFFVPNAFTPDGNGVNDEFFATGIGIAKFEMWIFDRWGNLIFTADDLYEKWDGTVQGKSGNLVQEDVYVWKVVLTDVFDKKHKYIGHVSVIR